MQMIYTSNDVYNRKTIRRFKQSEMTNHILESVFDKPNLLMRIILHIMVWCCSKSLEKKEKI